MKQVDPAIEARVVALIARGDTYKQILETMEKSNMRVSSKSIEKIKKRNAETISMLKTKLIEVESANALAIKQKANAMIDTSLDRAKTGAEIAAQADEDFKDGKIDSKEYERIKRSITKVSIPELVSVSKEMHAQTKGEEDPGATPLDREALAKAIQEGDEITINQLIFKRHA